MKNKSKLKEHKRPIKFVYYDEKGQKRVWFRTLPVKKVISIKGSCYVPEKV